MQSHLRVIRKEDKAVVSKNHNSREDAVEAMNNHARAMAA